ncbi:MAG: alpha/beta hydrolase-fold protein [Actinomycetota bacterium]
MSDVPPDIEDLIEAALRAEGNDRFDLIDELRRHPDLEGLHAPEAAGAAAALFAGSGDPSDLPAVARLSLLAHEAGISGAGRIHAEASDKIALYTGRPQLYGTVMLEQNGEIVQPPVNMSVSDEERVALGVPTLAELQERMAELTRELAVERAGQPGALPDGQPFCRVWTDPAPIDLRERMAVDGSAWADGDVLTLVKETPVPFAATPTFQLPSWDAGDGLQVLQLRIDRLDEAVLTYTFQSLDGPAAMNFSRGSHDGRFRGANAPVELPSNDDLVGSTFEHAVESEAMGEPRRVTVYRPPDHEQGEDIPVVYATDGNMFAPYMRRLDAAMASGMCPRVVFVAAHSAGFDPILGNLRASEYLPGFDERRFDAHQRFFVDELAAWAEDTLGVPTDPTQRGVFGCSDGGGHTLMVARLHKARFGHAFAYSTGMPPDMREEWTAEHPFIHLCAGTLEGAFHQATEAWAGFLMLQNAAYHFTERVAGHDLIQWAEELPHALTRAWGQTPSNPEGV